MLNHCVNRSTKIVSIGYNFNLFNSVLKNKLTFFDNFYKTKFRCQLIGDRINTNCMLNFQFFVIFVNIYFVNTKIIKRKIRVCILIRNFKLIRLTQFFHSKN